MKCACGCGQETNLAQQTARARGWVKGEPLRFVNHHARNLPGRLRHGHSRKGLESGAYKTWQAMRERCRTPSHTKWAMYGGRGITICPEWDSFEQFLADMGERPEGHSIDRIDPNGNYEPGNSRWATSSEQRHNQRRNQ